MKKLLIVLLSVFSLICCSYSAKAQSVETDNKQERIVSNEIVLLENGFIQETIIMESKEDVQTRNLAVPKSGTKTVNYKNASNELLWSVTVKGTFLYDQVTSTCTSSSVSTSVTNSVWKITSSSADKGGNTAYGYATAKRYYLGTVVQTVNETVSLTCSRTGVLS